MIEGGSPSFHKIMGARMYQYFHKVVRMGMAAIIATSAVAAQGAVIEDHVVVKKLTGRPATDAMPIGYEQAYSMRLGVGSWPYPYINLFIDEDPIKGGFANIMAGSAYLTYIQNVKIVQFDPLASTEISDKTLNDGSLKSFVDIKAHTMDNDQTLRFDSLTPSRFGNSIFLGFSYSDAQGQNPAYGWAVLEFTIADGLTVSGSGVTDSGAGIYAFTNQTIPAVPEASTMTMLNVGLIGIAGLAGFRRVSRRNLSA